MSKAIAFAILGIGAAVAGTGGIYLLNGYDFNDLPFDSHDDFVNKKKVGDCVKSHFGELDFSSKGELIDTSKALEDSYFSQDGETLSCLVINWQRDNSADTNTNKKWKGHFKWLWSLVKENKGMISVAIYKPTTAEKQMKLEGGVYFLGRDNASKPWSIKKYKEISSTKNISQSDLDTYFPKKGEGITDETSTNDYWGFVSSNFDLDNFCKSDDSSCLVNLVEPKIFKRFWTWKPLLTTSVNAKTIEKWSKTTLSGIYGSEGLTLTNTFSGIKGEWTK